MAKTARDLMGEAYVAVRAAGWAEKFARPEADEVLTLLRAAIAAHIAEIEWIKREPAATYTLVQVDAKRNIWEARRGANG